MVSKINLNSVIQLDMIEKDLLWLDISSHKCRWASMELPAMGGHDHGGLDQSMGGFDQISA